MKIVPYSESMGESWDDFCKKSEMSNFLHSRAFLSYHGDRFEDLSLVIKDESSDICALFPAARHPHDDSVVVSHPGATYGGIICQGRVDVSDVSAMLDLVLDWYSELGLRRLVYKTVPVHARKVNSTIDDYLLWKRGSLIRRDLWNVINLDDQRSLSKGRKWGVNRGRKAGLKFSQDTSIEALEEYYQVLSSNLRERHQTAPVHSFDDFVRLSRQFNDDISLYLARGADDRICAGVWLFKLSPFCLHTQYIASTEAGREVAAVDYLIENVIQCAQKEGVRWFSFGASTEQNGQVVNEGLFSFKAGFGIGSMTQDFFEINLQDGLR